MLNTNLELLFSADEKTRKFLLRFIFLGFCFFFMILNFFEKKIKSFFTLTQISLHEYSLYRTCFCW
jgi:hypothetical protein